MVPAEVAHEKLVEVGPTKSAVRGLAEQQVLDILAQELDPPVRCNPIDAVGGVGRDVKVLVRIKRHPIWHPGQTFRINFRHAGLATRLYFNAHHTVQIAFHHVEVPLRGVQGQAIGKMEGPLSKNFHPFIRSQAADHSVGLLPFARVAEVEIAFGVENTEIRTCELVLAHSLGHYGNAPTLAHVHKGPSVQIAHIDVLLLVQRNAKAEPTSFRQGLNLLAVRGNTVNLSCFAAGIKCAVTSHRYAFRMVQTRYEVPNFRDWIEHASPVDCRRHTAYETETW